MGFFLFIQQKCKSLGGGENVSEEGGKGIDKRNPFIVICMSYYMESVRCSFLDWVFF